MLRQPDSDTQKAPVRLVAADQRGTILILGIVLGSLLIGILFSLAAVGQDILWRENVQDAADEVAYQTALWNARGMNTIAQINIFIVIMMSVLMLWRLLLLFITAITAICWALCALAGVPFMQFMAVFCGVAGTFQGIMVNMLKQDERISTRLYGVMASLHRVEKVIAGATPPIGAVAAATATTLKYRSSGTADFAFALGMGLVPTEAILSRVGGKKHKNDKKVDPKQLPCGVAPGEPNKTIKREELLGSFTSLPVQADENEQDTLCEKAGNMIVRVLKFGLNELGKPIGLKLGRGKVWDKVEDVFGTIAESMSPVLCEDLVGVVNEKVEETLDEACGGFPDELPVGQTGTTRSQCEEEGRKKRKNDKKGPKAIHSDSVHYAQVWFYTGNGDLFMQSWGFARSSPPGMKDAPEEPPPPPPKPEWAVAAGDRNVVHDNASEDSPVRLEQHSWAVAEAEMFFDCGSDEEDPRISRRDDGKAGGWQACSQQAPFTPGWRARLRRVHDPLDFAVILGERVLVETFWNSVQRGVEKLPINRYVDQLFGKIGGSGGYAGRVLSNALMQTGRSELRERGKAFSYDAIDDSGFKSAAQRVVQDAWELDFIH